MADLVTIAQSQPLLRAELELFHPELLRQIEKINSGGENRNKIVRKSYRTLVSILSRAAGRATPSRVIGTVGTLHMNNVDGFGIVLSDEATLVGSRRSASVSSSDLEHAFLRWNPSAVVLGSRSYVTAPRKAAVDAFSSVGMNPLLFLINELARHPLACKELKASIRAAYPESSQNAIDTVIRQLIDKEVLLTEQDEGYHAYRRDRRQLREDFSLSVEGINDLSLNDASSLDIDLYRDANGHLPDSFDSTISDYLNHGFAHGAFGYNDSGITATFAELLLEKFGAVRVPMTHLIHPTKGLPWSAIKRAHNSAGPQKTSTYHRAAYTLGVQSETGWIDLQEVDDMLPTTGRHYSNFSSVDVIASLHGAVGREVYSMADAISSISAGSTTGRFDLLDNHVAKSDYAVNVDWISNQDAFNSVRESEVSFPRSINVNSFAVSDHELTISDLQIWSDGTDVHICDANGEPVEFQPTSMAGLGAFPEWVMQIAISGTAHTPDINWSWGEIENNVDYLPGVRFGSLILSRPAYRYTGDLNVEEFNLWADAQGIPKWIRVGGADKKLLIQRTADNFSELLISELRRGDRWIYSTFAEEFVPLTETSTGAKVFTEISRSYLVDCPQVSKHHLRETARKLPIAVRNSSREIIPATTDYVNLVLIPREGLYGRVLTTLFEGNPLSNEMYFVRYPSASGEPSIRLRFLRDADATALLRKSIQSMAESGLLLGIVEELHSFEIERYGGERIFPLFRRLGVIESLLVVRTARSFKDAAIPEEHHMNFIDWWLDLFPDYRDEIISFSSENQVFDGATQKEASQIVRAAAKESFSLMIPDELDQFMREIAQEITAYPLTAYELQSAAHLFCNRLGISTDREKALWLAFSKVERIKKHDRVRI